MTEGGILEERPWGCYQVFHEAETFKVKLIVVYPGKRLSLQRHQKRTEHWYLLQGEATMTLGSNTFLLGRGQSVDIPSGTLHRIENRGSGDLWFIEIQTGSYFGEDDIERFEDDFGRETGKALV